jgi:aspartate aminotransferase
MTVAGSPVASLVRAGAVPSSCLHEIYRAAELVERRSNKAVIKLHVGDPYFDPPRDVSEALVSAIRRGETKYTSVEGILEFREAIVEKLTTENQLGTDTDHVFVTPGSAQGLTSLFRALVEPGAEVLLPELHWPVHLQQSMFAGFRPVFYKLGKDFRPDVESIAAAATSRVRLLLINSPANPTGVVLDRDLLVDLVDLARKNGWQIISDEAYEHYVYEGRHMSTASLERELDDADRIVHSVFSFSKSAAMTGYRLGYVVTADRKTAEAMRVVQEASIIAPSTPIQHAGMAALRTSAAFSMNRAVVLSNRDRYLPLLRDVGLLKELPAGGWYAMLHVGRTGLDSAGFTEGLLERHGTAVVPGDGFALQPQLNDAGEVVSMRPAAWSRSLVRIAFCGNPRLLEAGVENIVTFTEHLG